MTFGAFEMLLRGEVDAAYQRGDLFEKSAALMCDWAAFCGAGDSETDVQAA